MPQTYKFVSFREGTSKDNKPYSILELSDGVQKFTPYLSDDAKDWFKENELDLVYGQDLEIEFSIKPSYKGVTVQVDSVELA